MSKALTRLNRWMRSHATAVYAATSLVYLVLFAAVLASLPILVHRTKDMTTERALYVGVIWGGLYVLHVICAALSISSLVRARRKTPPAVDPTDPPTPGVFSAAPGDAEVLCYCHGNPISDGQSVIHWPQPAQYTCTDTDKGISQ